MTAKSLALRSTLLLGSMLLLASNCDGTWRVADPLPPLSPPPGAPITPTPPPPTTPPPAPGDPTTEPWPVRVAKTCPPSLWWLDRATARLGDVYVDVASAAKADAVRRYVSERSAGATVTSAGQAPDGTQRLLLTGMGAPDVEDMRRSPLSVLPFQLAAGPSALTTPTVTAETAAPGIGRVPATFYLLPGDETALAVVKERLEHPAVRQPYTISYRSNGDAVVEVIDAPAELYEAFANPPEGSTLRLNVTLEAEEGDRNRRARERHRVETLANEHGLFGRGVTVAVHDQVGVFDHPALENRLIKGDCLTTCPYAADHPRRAEYCNVDAAATQCRISSRHATHVAGTIAARDDRRRQSEHGMAREASIVSRSFVSGRNAGVSSSSLTRTLAGDAARYGAYISNHSYGPVSGYDTTGKDDGRRHIFGAYRSQERTLDDFLSDRSSSDIVMVVAAGNDRDNRCKGSDCATKPPANGALYGCLLDPRTQQKNPGYGTINGYSTAKNTIAVAALDSTSDGNSLRRVTRFSNFGPSAAGRMNPEVAANGNTVTSLTIPNGTNRNRFEALLGTSMAAPVASGVAALLQQAAVDAGRTCALTGRQTLCTDGMKAALVSGARKDRIDGPDYRIGYGAIDAVRSHRIVAGIEGSSLLRTRVAKGGTARLALERIACEDCTPIVTAVWLDKGGAHLISDVDIRLLPPQGAAIYPWVLNPLEPYKAAERGVNPYDTIERIDVPPSRDTVGGGEWQLELRLNDGPGGRTVNTIDLAIALVGFRSKNP